MRVHLAVLAVAATALVVSLPGAYASVEDEEMDSPLHERRSPEEHTDAEDGGDAVMGPAPGFTEDDEAKIEAGRSSGTYEFESDTSRLLDILVNSLYTNKDVFMREVISNANDALEKIRFLSLSDTSQLGEGEQAELEIRVSFDEEAKTLTIRDRGVGMTKQDLISYLGTVAHSNTANFMEAVANGADNNLIGQFGVGFYSVYLIADRVRVASKHNEDSQHIWESAADGTFNVVEDPRGNTLGRGTEITLFLKDDAGEYGAETKVRELIKRYSEFITFPIYLQTVKKEEVEVPVEEDEDAEAEEGEEDTEEEEGDDAGEDGEEEEEEAPKTRMELKVTKEWELINEQKAIWQRSKDEITDEEYKGFYKAISKDYDDPLSWVHFTAEGEIEFRSILYIPKSAAYDLYDNYYSKSSSLRLYVRRVLISDEFDDLLPRYMSFIKGVVDSDDLPLNVNRETLQQHKVLKIMGKKLVRKGLELLRKLARGEEEAAKELEAKKEEGGDDEGDDEEGKDESEDSSAKEEEEAKLKERASQYKSFWKQYGKSIKLGVIEDSSNRSKLAKLLRFRTTKSVDENDLSSLEDYVSRMKSWQKQIYFVAAETYEKAVASPFLEPLLAKDLEVLLFTDPIDEYCVQNLPEFDGHRMQSISKENLKFGDEEEVDKKRIELYKTKFEPLTKLLTGLYGPKIEKVTVTNRLAQTPAVMVTSQYGYSANMERIMRSQAFADPSRAQVLSSKKNLELNVRHPIIVELNRRATESETPDEETTNMAWAVFDTAMLNSGFQMEDTKAFASRMYRLMQSGMNLDSLDLEEQIEVPEDDEIEDEEDDDEEEDDEEDGEDEDAGVGEEL